MMQTQPKDCIELNQQSNLQHIGGSWELLILSILK